MLTHHLAASLDKPGSALGVLWTSQIYLELTQQVLALLSLIVIEIVVQKVILTKISYFHAFFAFIV